uniref:Uncharacterized protein n=1 Tax=Rhizophora mucronata TaxID=61149 RepID=A0A2P2KX59_RHIMU
MAEEEESEGGLTSFFSSSIKRKSRCGTRESEVNERENKNN